METFVYFSQVFAKYQNLSYFFRCLKHSYLGGYRTIVSQLEKKCIFISLCSQVSIDHVEIRMFITIESEKTRNKFPNETMILFVFSFCYFKTTYSRLPPDKVQLDISQGRIIGTESMLLNQKPFYSFQGIPYAEPPIGPLRFAVKDY